MVLERSIDPHEMMHHVLLKNGHPAGQGHLEEHNGKKNKNKKK